MLARLLLSFSVVLTAFGVGAAEVDKTQPYQMMKQVAEVTFARLKAEQPKIKQDPNLLKVIVEQELMPYVNDRYAALKLLGPNLKGAKREDVLEFVDAFRAYLIASYAQVLTQYSDQQIEFGPEPKLDDSKRITSIKVEIIDAPRPNIKLEFKLRKDNKTDEWEAFDMVAEGISLLSSKQSEWNTKIRQDGILAVAQDLEKLAAEPIRFEAKKVMAQSHAQWQLQQDTLTLTGALDRDSVPSLWAFAQQWKPSQKELECSLEEIERVDSAGMVMLIHLLEHAKKQNCHIMLSFVPAQLRTLFQLSNVESLVAKHIKNYQG